MKKLLMPSGTVASAIACGLLVGCAPVLREQAPPPNQLGGSYGITHFPGLPAYGDDPGLPATEWGPKEAGWLQYLDARCHEQLDPYIPSAAKEIAVLSSRSGVATGIGGGVFGALGYVWRFTGVSFVDYLAAIGLTSFGSAVGSTAVAAQNQHKVAVGYVQYACMHNFVSYAASKGVLVGVGVVPWAGPTSMNPMPLPTTTTGTPQPAVPMNQQPAPPPPG